MFQMSANIRRGTQFLPRCLYTTASECNFFSITREHASRTQTDRSAAKPPEQKEMVVYNSRRNIDARPRKLNLLAKQIRYLPVSEAIRQMEFSPKQASKNIKEVLEETQEKAKNEHGIDDADNLWIAESYVGRGFIEKNVIRHGRGRFGRARKAFTHYFLVVKEGLPKPKQQRRTSEEKKLHSFSDYRPKIINSHSWW